MQIKRLEERVGRPIFARDGRASKLTEDGERLLDYARRIIKLNVEALATFNDKELIGRVRLGLPDDYVLPRRYSESCHLLGDGVSVPVVRFLAQNLLSPLLDATAIPAAAE